MTNTDITQEKWFSKLLTNKKIHSLENIIKNVLKTNFLIDRHIGRMRKRNLSTIYNK